jgi:hypothetical protein
MFTKNLNLICVLAVLALFAGATARADWVAVTLNADNPNRYEGN